MDIYKAIAKRIAHAEGYGLPNAVPTDARNPGDLMLGVRFNETVLHHGQPYTGVINGVTIFPKADWEADIEDHTDGCATLYREIRDILTGKSHIYHAAMTIQQIADLWTKTDPEDWAKAVSDGLGVTVDTPFNQILA